MERIIILYLFLFLLSCNTYHDTELTWHETDPNSKFVVKHGIPVYGKATVDYKRNDGTVLKIKLEEPVVVSVAEKTEKWGYYQFPNIARRSDNLLVATWSMAEDAITSYGKGGNGFKVSSDGGKTWNTAGPGAIYGGLVLPNGDRIAIYTPPALKVTEIQLPKPVGFNEEAYGRRFGYYRLDELPENLQGVYINRITRGETKWTKEHAALVDSHAIRYTDSGMFPVVWWGDMKTVSDNSIVAGIYPAFYENENGRVDPSGVSFYRSTDNGHNWKVQGRIPYQPDLIADPKGGKRLALGFTEPGFEILQDGTFLCVMRTTDGYGNSPMYISRSKDQGITWTKPMPFTAAGVLPRLLQLENGVTVLASGRPGVQLRFSTDGKGEKWTDPFELLPFDNEKETVSCGYTELLVTGSDRFLVIYSDFTYRNGKNEIRKAIKVREVMLTPK